MTPPVHFLDVSEHQGPIDWRAVELPAIVKATEGQSFTDRRYAENSVGAWSADRLLGFYHFLASTSPGIEQARHFLRKTNLVRSWAEQRDRRLVLALDWETDSIGVLPDESIAQAFVDELRRIEPDALLVLYGNNPRRPFAARNTLPFWCAWYPPEGAHERVAAELRAADTWAWQWTSDGTAAGIAGRVDCNTVLSPIPTMEGQTMSKEDVTQALSEYRLSLRDYNPDGTFTEPPTPDTPLPQAVAFTHTEAQLAAIAAERAEQAAARCEAAVHELAAGFAGGITTRIALDTDELAKAIAGALRSLFDRATA